MIVDSRRKFLKTLGGASAIGLLLPCSDKAQGGSQDLGNIAWCAKNAYLQAAGADASVGFNGVGYRDNRVFGYFANELQYLQQHINDYGIAQQIAQSTLPFPIDQFNPNFAQAAMIAAAFTPVPADFFMILPLGVAESDMSFQGGVTINNANDLNNTIDSCVNQLNVYAQGNFSATLRRSRRAHKEWLRLVLV